MHRDCPFYSFYALATTTHGSPSSSVRAVLTFHLVLRSPHLQQTARAVCANSQTLGEDINQAAKADAWLYVAKTIIFF